VTHPSTIRTTGGATTTSTTGVLRGGTNTSKEGSHVLGGGSVVLVSLDHGVKSCCKALISSSSSPLVGL
jgi:hypothetical protein